MFPATAPNLNTHGKDEEILRLIDQAIHNRRTFQQIPSPIHLTSFTSKISKPVKVVATFAGILGCSGMIYGGIVLADNDECRAALKNKGFAFVYGSAISLLLLGQAYLAKVFLSSQEEPSKKQ